MASNTDEPGSRDSSGRFKAGYSGNPSGGRLPADIREMLKAATPHAAARVIEALDAMTVVHHNGVEIGTYVDHRMRLAAAEAIFNRLYGKPRQEVTGEDGQPLQVSVDLAGMLTRLAGG